MILATPATKRRPPRRPAQYPKKRQALRTFGGRGWLIAAAGLVVVAGAVIAFFATRGGEEATPAGRAAAAAGLPNTPDYHSLLVAPNDPAGLVLGTHEGLFRSVDGGRTWEEAALAGHDAMNLARAGGSVVWTAGHNVFAKSTDGGTSWQDVRPDGLPHLDIHGFAVDPRNPNTLWAALAGEGLYRSADGGESFELVTREVGAGVMALAVTRDGRILAGDMQQGLFASSDDGRSWSVTLQAGLMGLAVNPAEPERILASGPGILLSEDGGQNWEQVYAIEQGAGPVAWSPSKPDVAYVVGFDQRLYKTSDGGRTWQPVT